VRSHPVAIGLMTPEEVAQRLNIKPRTLFDYLRNGLIVGVKIGGGGQRGGRWMISCDAYNAFIREKEQEHLQAIARMRAPSLGGASTEGAVATPPAEAVSSMEQPPTQHGRHGAERGSSSATSR
jgi:hypothetical protein